MANQSNHGICSTCKSDPGCSFRQNANRLPWHCEEFELEAPVRQTSAGPNRSQAPRPRAAERNDAAQLSGLCSDCEGHSSCTFPGAEGGVWHCEEYR